MKCYEREREWGLIFSTAFRRDLKEGSLEPGRLKLDTEEKHKDS